MMLKVENLCCRRNRRIVFRALSFTLAAGGMLHITGKNGSGKSSLLRILAGLLPPASGGFLPVKAHYIGHLDAVKPHLTVDEMLTYWGALRGGKGDADALGAFGLQALRDCRIRDLSAGQKRRLSLTRLAMDDAPLWLLDEPTNALDDEGRDLLFAAMARYRACGGMIVAAAHEVWDLPAMDILALGAG